MIRKCDIQLTAVIIRGGERWEKTLFQGHWATPIWKLCTETGRQFESDEFLRGQDFKLVMWSA